MNEVEERLRNGKTPQIEIRPMEIDDLASVFHLGEKIFTTKMPNLYRTWDEYEVVDFYNTDPDLCLVAEDEKEKAIVGFLLGTTIEKNNSSWKYGHLVWLGVSPEHKGGGVGRKLVNEFRHLIQKEGVRMLIVDTQADNENALKFFERLGFTNPEEHVYLSLNLSAGKKK